MNSFFYCNLVLFFHGLVFFWGYPTDVYSQKMGSNWVFGTDNWLVFDKDSVTVKKTVCSQLEASATFSNKEGKLICYHSSTDSTFFLTYVFDGNNNKISKQYIELLNSATNGSVFISDSSSKKIKLFTISLVDLYYNTFELQEDGKYKHVVINKKIPNDGSLAESIAAIKHQNGRDWWLIVQERYNIIIYLITENDIIKTHTIGQPPQPGNLSIGTGEISVATNGEHLAFINSTFPKSGNGKLSKKSSIIFNFDRCTGKLSFNQEVIFDNKDWGSLSYGLSFSPKAKYLFVSTGFWESGLYRYDLERKQLKNIYNTYKVSSDTTIQYSLGGLELGLDGKIYVASVVHRQETVFGDYKESTYLGVIERPDDPIVNFNPLGLKLKGKSSCFGLPNMPNYELGALFFPEVARAGRYADTLYMCYTDSVRLGTFKRDNIQYRWNSTAVGLAGLESDTEAAPWFRGHSGVKPSGDTVRFVLSCQGLQVSCWPGETAVDTVVVIVRPQGDTLSCSPTSRPVLDHLTAQRKLFQIYPNPASDKFVVDYQLPESPMVVFEVFNTLGQKMFSQPISPQSNISTQNWPAGVYICKFQVNNQIITQKLVISR